MSKKEISQSFLTHVLGPIFLVGSLAIIEVILWWLNFPTWMQSGALLGQPIFHMPDSELGWVNKPGHYELTDGTRQIVMNFNADSTRRASNTVSSELPSIVLLGDSFMQGYGLSDEATLGWLIQERLFENYVRNYGTGGYGTYQSYLTLRKIVAQTDHSKISRFVYLFNDFHEERNVGAPSWQTFINPPSEELEFSFPYGETFENGSEQLKETRTGGLIPWGLSLRVRSLALVNTLYWQIEAMHRLSKKREVTILTLKAMAETAKDIPLYVVFNRFSAEDQKAFTEALSKTSIRWIDCALPEQYEKEYRLSDGHPNEAMNRLTASCMLAGGFN